MLAPKVDFGEVRDLFTVASKDEAACEKLIKLTDGYTMDYKPVIFAYNAAAEMTMANHYTWPGSKLKTFRNGRIKLESVVKKYNSSVEIRYIRYAVQKGSPDFLNYKTDLDTDRQFIKKNLGKSKLPPGQKEIIKATIAQ